MLGSQKILQTWFIDHALHRICRESRFVTLRHTSFNWQEQIEAVWRDMIDPNKPTIITFVDVPARAQRPPGDAVIVWQTPCPGLVVALHMQGNPPFQIEDLTMQAVSVEERIFARALQAFGTWNSQRQSVQHLWFLLREVHPHQHIALYDGIAWLFELADQPDGVCPG